MRFFSLECPVGNDAASVQEITTCKVQLVEQLSRNYSSKKIIQGLLICKFVKELVPIKHTKAGTVLELIFSDLKVDQDKLVYFRTEFYNKMALDMNNAIKTWKINTSDMIVLQRPVVRLNKRVKCSTGESLLNEAVTVEIGRFNDQSIEVWQHNSDTVNKALSLKSISHCISQLCIKSLEDFIKSTSEDLYKGTILSYFIRTVKFWKKEGQVKKAISFFREIQPNGKVGYFFQMALHRSFACEFYQGIKDKSVVPGDIIAFINPVVFINPVYESAFLSDEPYFLEIGCKETEKIVYCKKDKNLHILTEDPPAEQRITSPVKASLTAPQDIKVSYNHLLSFQLASADTFKLSDSNNIILVLLKTPSKGTLNHQNLSLVSGHCYQFCQKMFMYSEIVWNAKKEPLCPKCYVLLELCLCLEFYALTDLPIKIVKVLLAGKKAEEFLLVTCTNFLNDNEKRKLTLKYLESKYVYGSEYAPYKLGISEVSYICSN